MNQPDQPKYGDRDASFRAAGGEPGVRAMVDAFYDLMSSDNRFARIYEMHPDDKMLSRDKLASFLCGWLGGPKRYHEKFGSINIPRVHQHLPIAEAERNMWLDCMAEAVAAQPFADEFKQYLLEQLGLPAEAVRRRCSSQSAAE
jgi:hemoglobin